MNTYISITWPKTNRGSIGFRIHFLPVPLFVKLIVLNAIILVCSQLIRYSFLAIFSSSEYRLPVHLVGTDPLSNGLNPCSFSRHQKLYYDNFIFCVSLHLTSLKDVTVLFVEFANNLNINFQLLLKVKEFRKKVKGLEKYIQQYTIRNINQWSSPLEFQPFLIQLNRSKVTQQLKALPSKTNFIKIKVSVAF